MQLSEVDGRAISSSIDSPVVRFVTFGRLTGPLITIVGQVSISPSLVTPLDPSEVEAPNTTGNVNGKAVDPPEVDGIDSGTYAGICAPPN